MIARFLCAALLAAACTPASNNSAGPALPPEQQAQLDAELAEIDACGYVGCQSPHHPAGALDFGALPTGAHVTSIPERATISRGDCVGRPFPDDGPSGMCGFLIDGVTYVVIDRKIAAKAINLGESPDAALPFGLARGQTPDQVLAALRAQVDAPLSIETLPGDLGRYVRNDGVLRNESGAPVLFSALFVADGLMGLYLQDPSAPSD